MSSSRPNTPGQAKAGSARRAKGAKPAGSRKKVWAKRLGIAALGGFVLALVGFFTAYALIQTPEPNDLASAQASVIYYADGKTELDRISEVNRESVKLPQIPTVVREAHLAAEDRTFYENSGISPTGIARAVWVGLRGGATQGGSTITQQYVKNYFLTQDQTLTRKGKEIVISIKIAKQKSKDQILEDYLNTIYYGRGAYGVQTASKAYFNKDVSKLTVSEGALLASVIRGPSFYDPGLGAEQTQNAKDRWTYVMDGMVSQGYLSADERAKAKFPKVVKYTPDKGASGPNGFITNAVKGELKSKLKLTDADIDRGGYKIVTTIDKKAQDAAIAAVKERMPTGKGTDTLRVGLTSIKPGDGAVVAMYGGSDYRKEQFNTATQATMQAGSTFKIFTLLAALSQKDPISTKTKFDGRTPQYFKEFEDSGAATDFLKRGGVRNFGPFPGEPFGNIDLRTATGHSVNTVYAQLNIKVGPKATRDAAVAAGLPSKGLGHQLRQRPGHLPGEGHRHGQRLRHHRGEGPARHAVLHQDRQGRPGQPRLQGQARQEGGLRRRCHGRRHRRDGRADQGRHRRVRAEPRSPRGRQDRHDDRQQGGLVRRVHSPARHGCGHLQQRQERRGAVDERRQRGR